MEKTFCVLCIYYSMNLKKIPARIPEQVWSVQSLQMINCYRLNRRLCVQLAESATSAQRETQCSTEIFHQLVAGSVVVCWGTSVPAQLCRFEVPNGRTILFAITRHNKSHWCKRQTQLPHSNCTNVKFILCK